MFPFARPGSAPEAGRGKGSASRRGFPVIPHDTIIARNDSYITAHPRNGCCATARFYLRLLGIVFSSSSRAKHGRYHDREWVNSSIDVLNALEAAGCRFEIRGMDVLRAIDGPAVFVANHMSTLETFILPSLINPVRKVTFVIKPSLMEYPVFRHVMRSRNPIVVSRDNPRQDLVTVMEEGARRIAEGTSIILFPQTTRTARFDPAAFNSLGVKLARASGAVVVPIALKTDAWDNGRMFKDFGPIHPERTVHIQFGHPLPVTGNGREQHDETVRFISEHLAAWSSPA